jgi:myo-inositol-1(or 4)-monophosphatase
MSLPGFDAALLELLARKAGAIIKATFRFSGVERTWKDEGTPNLTPVTAADTEVNRLIVAELRKRFPTDEVSITGEEQSDERPNPRYRIFCDPIDGTFPFAAGIPVSTFMLALVEGDTPLAAVIYDPFGDQLYLAQRGQGATLNGRALRTSQVTQLSTKTVIGSCWWNTAPYNIGLINAVLPSLYDASLINLVSIGYMGAKVASGEFAATIFPGSNAHDSAPLHLLVQEAGGVVTDLFGEPLRYDRPLRGHLAAANATLHQTLLGVVKRFNPGR